MIATSRYAGLRCTSHVKRNHQSHLKHCKRMNNHAIKKLERKDIFNIKWGSAISNDHEILPYLSPYIMEESHPDYAQILKVLRVAGKDFDRYFASDHFSTDLDIKNLAEKGIVQLYPGVFKLGDTGWVARTCQDSFFSFSIFDNYYGHAKRALHAAKCRRICKEHQLSIKIPEKFLFPANVIRYSDVCFPRQFYVIYKDLNIMPGQGFKDLLINSQGTLVKVSEQIAKFIRLTSYNGIRVTPYEDLLSANFGYTLDGKKGQELALLDTDEHLFRNWYYPKSKEINLDVSIIFDQLAKCKIYKDKVTHGETVFDLPAAREVFLTHAQEVEALMTENQKKRKEEIYKITTNSLGILVAVA